MCQSRVRGRRGPSQSQMIISNRARGYQSSAFLKFLCGAPFIMASSYQLRPTSRGNSRGLYLHLSLTQTEEQDGRENDSSSLRTKTGSSLGLTSLFMKSKASLGLWLLSCPCSNHGSAPAAILSSW